MKKLVFIVVFIMFLKPVFPFLEYVIHYDYISKELCENKAKPELKCNGKCHLMKELAKASEDEKPISNNKKDNSKQEIEVLFCQEILPLQLTQIYFHSNPQKDNHYSNLYFHLNSSVVFHPPILSC